IREYNPDAAVCFLSAIDSTVAGLAAQPTKGRLRKFRSRLLRGVRSWRVNDFENYLMFYRCDGKLLEILRIRHGAMNFPQALLRRNAV
ncbi:MAG: type II toxin-antitoxin system RelE/ParE family toxin, partial [Verrucomicrobiota bacterium]